MQKPSSDRSASGYSPSPWGGRVISVAGILLIALGTVAAAGWHLGIPRLVYFFPSFGLMAHNTALGFILSGAGLLGISFLRPTLTASCGATVCILGLVSFGEYLFGFDIGINEWLIQHPIDPRTSLPLRMAPNTALAFALAGAAFWLCRRLGPSLWRHVLAAIFASSVVTLGAAGLVGYAIGADKAYAWGDFSMMAFHTAIGLVILGSILFLVTWQRERTTVPLAATLILGLGFSLISFAFLREHEERRLAVDFEDAANDRIRLIKRELFHHLEVVRSVSALHAATLEVDRDGFRAFLTTVFQLHDEEEVFGKRVSEILGVAWIPRVPDSQRSSYEQTARREGSPHFEFMEKAPDGRIVPAGRRAEYFPIYFVEPLVRNQGILGLDMSKDQRHREAMETACDQGVPAACEPISLADLDKTAPDQIALLIFVPIYQNGMPHDTIEQRREHLQGFAMGVFRVAGIMEGVLAYLAPGDVDLRLFDASASPMKLLYEHSSRLRARDLEPPSPKDSSRANSLKVESTMKYANRKLLIQCTPSPGRLKLGWFSPALGMLSGGLVFTGMLALYLFRGARRAGEINQLVAERTMQLSQSEERYRSLITNSPNVTWRSDFNGNMVFISANVEKVYGFKAEEVVADGKRLWLGRIHPEDVGRMAQARGALFERGAPFDEEYRIQHTDGRWIWIHDRATSTIEDQSIRYADGVFYDVTDRKLAEKERDRLIFILEATSDYVAVAMPDGRLLYINRAGRRMLGIGEAEDITRMTIADTYPHSIVDFLFKEAIPTAIRTGTWSSETVIMSRDGREIPVSQVIVVHKDASGGVEFLSTIMRDISEIKRTQEELVRLSSAIENAAEAVVVTDLEANIQYVNPAFEEISGYSKQEVLGKNPRIVNSGKMGPGYYRKLWDTLKHGEVWTGEFINKKKDGTLYHQEGSIAPIRKLSGKIFGYVAVQRDVTKQIQLEAELRQAQKMEAIGQLAGGIAHDFNNILASILGYAKLAADVVAEGGELRDDLEQIITAGRRGKELVERMLVFSRQARVAGNKTPHQLGEIIKESLKLIRPALPSNISIDVKIPPDLPFVMIDPIEIHQVIINLCINSCQAMPEGGRLYIGLEEARISGEDASKIKNVAGIQELTSGHYVILSVEDTGSGIPKEVLPRIFEPFFTTRKTDKGTGMGLAVAYGIVKSHHGTIHVYTEPGRGTTMRVYLPTSETAPVSRAETKQSLKRGSELILVVDDEESLAEMIGQTLTRLGYRVTVKTVSAEALELFRQSPGDFDLVITDQTMPGMTGDRLAEEIRRVRPDIPIILCSGYSEILTPEREKEIQVSKLLRKPFVGDELGIEIRRLLDEKNSERCITSQ